MKKVSAPVSSVKESELEVNIRVALIQSLIPLGLAAVEDLLQQEVSQLAGARYARKDTDTSCRRWGQQTGSVYLADQKVPLEVPRVRDLAKGQEISLASYQALQQPRSLDEGLLLRILRGLSNRDYEVCAEAVPSAFGLSKSSVSRRYVRATAAKLAQFQSRPLEDLDLVALYIDGKSFAAEEMIIVLGVTLDGRKIPLDFIQAATENERVCRQLIQQLIQRGLSYEQGLLVLLDGSKGLYAAMTKALTGYVVVQRCQWHKRENILSHLPKSQQATVRRQLQEAYAIEDYAQAKAALQRMMPQLQLINQSAAKSLVEGLEETLTLNRLGLADLLKDSFRTTNCLESINGLIEQRTQKVKRWTSSNQRYRWLAAALIDIEPRLHRVKGYRHLPLLRKALQKELNLEKNAQSA
jgi:putative transposase|tara:strand:- start:180 stop:1412 length:1233 start_codon:yes stop_codon:yes gene_type:complete